jgi:hypothetical protein
MKIFGTYMPFDQLNGVAMVFVLLYDSLPDSIKVNQMSGSLDLRRPPYVFSKLNYAQSPIRIRSISGLTATIRIPAHCEQVQRRLSHKAL